MKPDEALYFIALIPPEPLAGQLNTLKEYFAKGYNSKASLNSPPHITLHMPFRWRTKKLNLLVSGLEELADSCSPFSVHLKNFGAFPPRVIFIDVVPNQNLDRLQQQVVETARKKWKLDNANYRDRAFHPHITLAFRDLRKPQFKAAWEEFGNKDFAGSFRVLNVGLLKHDGVRWQLEQTFKLKDRSASDWQ